jgi:hypothetical protein
MKVILDLTETQLANIAEWFSYQDIDDTRKIINKYELDLECEEADKALTQLYNQISDAIEK